MAIARYLIPFAAGVAVGATLHKYWPEITKASRPLLRSSLRGGSELLDKGREVVWGQTERLADIISEIREEDEAEARAAAQAAGGPPKEPAGG